MTVQSRKRARLDWTLAAVALFLVPFIPEELTAVVRALSVIAGTLLAITAWLAYVPPKITIGIPRVGLLLAVVAGLIYLPSRNLEVAGSFTVGYLMLAALALAVGPAVSIAFRRWLYGGAVYGVGALLLIGIGSQESLGDALSSVMKLGYFCIVYSAYSKWSKTGRSSWLVFLERAQAESTAILQCVGGKLPVKKFFQQAPRRKLVAELIDIGRQTLPPLDLYVKVLLACKNHSSDPLAWQLAYWAAVRRNDIKTAKQLKIDAKAAGIEDLTKMRAPRKDPEPFKALIEENPEFRRLTEALNVVVAT